MNEIWTGWIVPATAVLGSLIAMDRWLKWVAAGEADVNGAPERDAGADGTAPRGLAETCLREKAAGDIKQVCAYCPEPRFLGGNPNGVILSHGICAACAEKVLQEHFNHRNQESAGTSKSYQASLGRFINLLPAHRVSVGTFEEEKTREWRSARREVDLTANEEKKSASCDVGAYEMEVGVRGLAGARPSGAGGEEFYLRTEDVEAA